MTLKSGFGDVHGQRELLYQYRASMYFLFSSFYHIMMNKDVYNVLTRDKYSYKNSSDVLGLVFVVYIRNINEIIH